MEGKNIVRSIKDLPSCMGANLLGGILEDIGIQTLPDETLRILLKIGNNNVFAIDTHSKEINTAVIK